MAASPPPPVPSGLYQFLLQFRVEKGAEFTHTSFSRPAGSFYIPGHRADEFMELYCEALANGEDLHITEKHRAIGPVVVDLDFRFELPPAAAAAAAAADAVKPERRYTAETVERFLGAYCGCLGSMVAVPEFDVYVLEKLGGPRVHKGVVKDGVHFQVPGVVTRPSVQLLARSKFLQGCADDAFGGLGLANSWDDVFDEAVIERNNWLMYGSKKPGGEPYVITRAYRYSHASGALTALPPASTTSTTSTTPTTTSTTPTTTSTTPTTTSTTSTTSTTLGTPTTSTTVCASAVGVGGAQGPHVLSVRNKFEESALRPEFADDVAEFEAAAEEQRRRRELMREVCLTTSPSASGALNLCDNLDLVCRLVDVLDASRVQGYNEWVRMGWCLRNIDHRLLPKWVEVSRKSPKFQEGECERMWAQMRLGGLNVGTLHMWARKDSPDAYAEIIRADLGELLQRSVSGTHHDIACVVHQMYRYEYVCASIRNRTWYEFRDHRWHNSDSACSLRKRISAEVFREYTQRALHHQQRAVNVDVDPDDQKRNMEMCTKLNAIALKLKLTDFKDKIIKECCELFYHEKFEEKLDSNGGLLGFVNGVYDLDNGEFREGRPDDFISYTTGINYVPYAPDMPHMHEIRRYWAQVLTDERIREYVLTLMASWICGHTREERFHIWTGSGSNSKSISVELYDKVLGDYSCKFPVTLLTQKRAASNSATSEIARAKGRRFACLQEPSEDERLNIGLLKELTGGDKVQARAIYKEPVEFKPQWHIALLCNHLPHVPSDDGGTWRRIRVVEFTSKFVERPVAPNEFPVDLGLSQKLDAWREPFMALLIEYYRTRVVNRRIEEPDAVMACTRDYQKNNDHNADFIDTCIEKTDCDDDVVTVNDAFAEFRAWIREDNIPAKLPKKKELQKVLDRALGKAVTMGGDHCYRRHRLRDRFGKAAGSAASDADI